MSDDAYQYFNAWTGVFGTKETTKLLCAWHVDRAWRTGLSQHVTNKQSRVEIYHQLQILLTENEEPNFRQILQQFLSSLESTEPAFSKYFKENYCNRLGEWASHFRVGSVVNTNMFLESFHRTLKVVYLQHKHNRRIDYLLNILLKIARDKIFEQLTKLEKGKFTHRVSEINKRHKEAVKMKPQVKVLDDNTWNITSARHKGIHYTIKKVMDICSCKLRCSTCGTCVHMYTCSCIDASLHATVCKHVHAISMLSVKPIANSPNATGIDEIKYFTTILNDTQQSNQLERMRKQLFDKIHEITVLVSNCPSMDALKASSAHLTSAIVAIKAVERSAELQVDTLNRKRKIPPNKKMEKQHRFFSTKKQKLSHRKSNKLSKPSHIEAQQTRLSLQSQETTCCGICLQEDDNSSSSTVTWLQCGSCDLWVHATCVHQDYSHEHDYSCPFCSDYSY